MVTIGRANALLTTQYPPGNPIRHPVPTRFITASLPANRPTVLAASFTESASPVLGGKHPPEKMLTMPSQHLLNPPKIHQVYTGVKNFHRSKPPAEFNWLGFHIAISFNNTVIQERSIWITSVCPSADPPSDVCLCETQIGTAARGVLHFFKLFAAGVLRAFQLQINQMFRRRQRPATCPGSIVRPFAQEWAYVSAANRRQS